MPESVGWIGFAMAVVSLARQGWTEWNNRKAKESQLAHEERMAEIERRAEAKDTQIAALQSEVASLKTKVAACETDREDLQKQLDALKPKSPELKSL